MLGGVFICYRREDTSGFAGRIHDRLIESLGSDSVFLDVDSIVPGADFVDVLAERIGRCDALVAVIGKRWISAVDEAGKRRIDDPSDYVRLEIEAALTRGIRVIPVLVDGAVLPRAEELPDSLKRLTRRQAIEVSHSQFNTDVERLNGALSELENELAARGGGTVGRGPGRARDAPDRIRPAMGRNGVLGFPAPRGNALVWAAMLTVAVTAVVGAGLALYPRREPERSFDRGNAGFDCTRARYQVELMVCESATLSEKDRRLNQAYDVLRRSMGDDGRKRLDAERDAWLPVRNDCKSADCIGKWYDERIALLTARLQAPPGNPPAGQPASPAPGPP